MVRIRMQRFGRTHRPFYRIAAMESREPRNGKVLENLGWFNPLETEQSKRISLKPDRIKAWIEQGARPTETVRDLLATHEVLDEKAIASWEADRTARRAAIESKKAAEKAQALVTEFREFAEQAEADVESHLATAKSARADAAVAARRNNVEGATAALAKVEDAFAAAKKAEETSQAKAAAAAPGETADDNADDAADEKSED